MRGLVFGPIKNDKQVYIRSKVLAGLEEPHNLSDADIDAMFSDVTESSLPLADVTNLQLPDNHRANIEARKRCALRDLRTESPLLPDEVVEEDVFTYLTQPVEELPAGTAVLKRTTNQATLYYVYSDFQVTPELELVYTGPPQELLESDAPSEESEPEEVVSFGLGLNLDFKEIAKSAATGLISGVAGKIGALIFDAIFPPSVPTYFDDVYKQIGKIVQTQLQQHDIDLIQAKLNGVLDWQRRIYAPKNPRAVTDPKEREKLYTEVTGKINELEDAMSILRSEKWKEAGCSVFVIAGNIYLGLCQEACMVDYHTTNPQLSSYATTVKLTAQDFAASLQQTYNAILKKRVDAITTGRDYKNMKIGTKYYMFPVLFWVDPIAGTKGPRRSKRKVDNKTVAGDPEAELQADISAYKASLPDKLKAELGDPAGIAAKWQTLVNQPLPKV